MRFARMDLTHLLCSKEQLAEEVDKTRGLIVKVKGRTRKSRRRLLLWKRW